MLARIARKIVLGLRKMLVRLAHRIVRQQKNGTVVRAFRLAEHRIEYQHKDRTVVRTLPAVVRSTAGPTYSDPEKKMVGRDAGADSQS